MPKTICFTGCMGPRDTSILNCGLQTLQWAKHWEIKEKSQHSELVVGMYRLTTGLSDDLCENNKTHKTIVFNKELHQLQVDIGALQETWLPESGNLREREYTFFWREKAKTRSDNTVLALSWKKSLMMVELGKDGLEWIYSLWLYTSDGTVTLFSAYAPTLYSTHNIKDEFYDQLSMKIQIILNRTVSNTW